MILSGDNKDDVFGAHTRRSNDESFRTGWIDVVENVLDRRWER